MILPDDGCIKRIHVNQHNLRRVLKGGAHASACTEELYVYTVQYKGKSHPCNEVTIHGQSQAVNSINKPLSCGARLFIQTTGSVTLSL